MNEQVSVEQSGDSSEISAAEKIRRLEQEIEVLSEENTGLKEQVDELRHDGLTGLLIKSEWRKGLEEAKQAGDPVLVGIMDINGAKIINDKYGHERLDSIIAALGQELRDNFRESDGFTYDRLFPLPEDGKDEASLSRYGGDEVCFYNPLTVRGKEGEEPLSDEQRAEVVRNRYREVINKFVDKQDDEIKDAGFGIALGFAVYIPGSDVSSSELINDADREMRENKRAQNAPER